VVGVQRSQVHPARAHPARAHQARAQQAQPLRDAPSQFHPMRFRQEPSGFAPQPGSRSRMPTLQPPRMPFARSSISSSTVPGTASRPDRSASVRSTLLCPRPSRFRDLAPSARRVSRNKAPSFYGRTLYKHGCSRNQILCGCRYESGHGSSSLAARASRKYTGMRLATSNQLGTQR